ncbi:MAG: 2-keto-3-deoxy-L-rhamnonate aldolase RhmA [Alphaproteobacteria bacterium]|jgi:2-keto-3-deoxy-L-rhamnonate aldolase RhmA
MTEANNKANNMANNMDGMLGAQMKRRLADGQLVLCATVRFSRTVEIVQISRIAGYDAIYCDMEHSSLTIDQVAQISQAAALAGLMPLARVPSHDHDWMSRVLDGGCQGVIVPHVDDAETAKACIAACCYPPLGARSLAGYGPLAGQSVGVEESYRLINDNTTLIVMLESPTAIANADAIAAVKGVDMLLIGTNDLCAELGIPGKLDHPKIRDAYQKTADACKKHGKALGVGGIKDGPMLTDVINMGARFLMGRVDGALLQQAASKEVTELRKLVD